MSSDPGGVAVRAEIRKGWTCECGAAMEEIGRSSQFIPEPPQCWVTFRCPAGHQAEIVYSDFYSLDKRGTGTVEVWPHRSDKNDSRRRSVPYP